MKYDLIIRKLKYYRDWYNSLSLEEIKSAIGKWIYDRAIIFHSLLADFEKDKTTVHVIDGNYTSNWTKEQLN
jgi:hypothetical protein